jgi:hypothetical protein
MNSAKSKRMQDIADADAEGYFTGKYWRRLSKWKLQNNF